MESDHNTLSNELDIIFHGCSTERPNSAKVLSLIDAFVSKYGKDQSGLRSILSEKLDPNGNNPSISRSHFKHMMLEWITSNNPDEHNNPKESSINSDKMEIFEYGSASCAHSTPLGIFNKRYRKITTKKLSYSPGLGFSNDSLENHVLGVSSNEELKAFKAHSKTQNSSLENSLIIAEQKISSLEAELKEIKLHSKKEIERYKEELCRLKVMEKSHAETIDKNEKYEEALNNLTKEYNKLKHSKDNLDKSYTNLETENHRLQNELDSKNVSLKTLETFKRVHTEELVVLHESKDILEYEVLRLKIDVKSLSENEKALLVRIGELQSEKKNLQAELNEFMNFEKMKMVSSSPFGKSSFYDDHFKEENEENRESGISMRSELMDSLGFSSCIHDSTLHLPYFSMTEEVPLGCGATQLDWIAERSEKIEIGIQTEEIRLKKIEKEMQTEENRSTKREKGMQTRNSTETRPEQIEKGNQTHGINETCSAKTNREVQTDEKRNVDAENLPICLSENMTDHHFDSRCFNSRMEIDSSLEEFHQSMDSFWNNGKTYNEQRRSDSENNGNSCAYDRVPLFTKPNMSAPQLRIRRVEPRRFSCLDIYKNPVSICRPNTYQRLTFSRKISTIFAGIFSIISPSIRICMKTSLLIVTGALLFLIFISMFITTRRFDGALQQFFQPYLHLKFPKGSPPS